MKKSLSTFLAVLVLASLACGITLTLPDDAIEIGELRTDPIFISAPSSPEAVDVKLEFGAGDLYLHPGTIDWLISGVATYNVDSMAPKIVSSGREVILEQEPYKFKLGGLPNMNEVENTWDLAFSTHPINLEVRAGAYEGTFEFGGLALQEVHITSGASKNKISFNEPNRTSMSEFRFRTGASSVDLTGLANANFSLMKFEGGAGSYTLDFSGTLIRDATIEIDAALSNIKIIVPQGIPASVQVESGLTNVNARGAWSGTGNFYSLDGQGPSLTFIVKVGGGNVDLSTLP